MCFCICLMCGIFYLIKISDEDNSVMIRLSGFTFCTAWSLLTLLCTVCETDKQMMMMMMMIKMLINTRTADRIKLVFRCSGYTRSFIFVLIHVIVTPNAAQDCGRLVLAENGYESRVVNSSC